MLWPSRNRQPEWRFAKLSPRYRFYSQWRRNLLNIDDTVRRLSITHEAPRLRVRVDGAMSQIGAILCREMDGFTFFCPGCLDPHWIGDGWKFNVDPAGRRLGGCQRTRFDAGGRVHDADDRG